MTDLPSLIHRLESAQEGSRELDWEIWAFDKDAVKRSDDEWLALCASRENSVPFFSTSIDSALTLLPAWMSFELTQSAADPKRTALKRCRLWDWRRGPLMSDPNNEWKSEGRAPLPVHVCIAALKARGVA